MNSALIVGASRGLGLSLVKVLVERGLPVVALHRDESRELASLREVHPDLLKTYVVDVRKPGDFEHVAKALAESTPVDLFIYNAAVHLERDRRDVEDANVDDVLQTLDVNAVGAVRAVKHLSQFVARDGLVVLISSEAGSLTDNWRPSEYGYCMSKAALNMLARLLSVRERERNLGIRVLALHPGWLRTDMGGPNADVGADEAARDIVETLATRFAEASAGPGFVDRFGKAMSW